MSRERESRIWADLTYLLGREGIAVREAGERLGISYHRADYYRKQLSRKGLVTHVGNGAYDITGTGEEFVARWGSRETSEPPGDDSSETTVEANLRDHRDINLWEVHNSRFTLPVLRAPADQPKPTRLLGGKTPIVRVLLRPPHPQDPRHEVPTTLELWGKTPKTARFYLGTFRVLTVRRKVLVIQEDVARAAIQEAKKEAGVALPRTPAPDNWHEDPKAAGSALPLPSGHARVALPELQGIIQSLVETGPTSWMDNSPGPGFETPDIPLIDQADRLFRDLRLGRFPEELEAQKEAVVANRQALITLARRMDRVEANR